MRAPAAPRAAHGARRAHARLEPPPRGATACLLKCAAKLHPGVYALKVYGNLSEEMVAVLEENGVPYAPNEEDD